MITSHPSITYRLSHLRHRKHFPNLLNPRHAYSDAEVRSGHFDGKSPRNPPLLRSAVEIGTHRGEFAEMLLSGWATKDPPGVLHCVDPWLTAGQEGYDQPEAHGDRNADYAECIQRLARFGNRVQFIRKLSRDAVREFRDGSLDFVYIDGNHRRPFVDEDLRLWWPKVKIGGVFAGHDLTGVWDGQVKPAVEEWAAGAGVAEIMVVLGDAVKRYPPWGDCASWYAIKANKGVTE